VTGALKISASVSLLAYAAAAAALFTRKRSSKRRFGR
jgi:hypothetical protein